MDCAKVPNSEIYCTKREKEKDLTNMNNAGDRA